MLASLLYTTATYDMGDVVRMEANGSGLGDGEGGGGAEGVEEDSSCSRTWTEAPPFFLLPEKTCKKENPQR